MLIAKTPSVTIEEDIVSHSSDAICLKVYLKVVYTTGYIITSHVVCQLHKTKYAYSKIAYASVFALAQIELELLHCATSKHRVEISCPAFVIASQHSTLGHKQCPLSDYVRILLLGRCTVSYIYSITTNPTTRTTTHPKTPNLKPPGNNNDSHPQKRVVHRISSTF